MAKKSKQNVSTWLKEHQAFVAVASIAALLILGFSLNSGGDLQGRFSSPFGSPALIDDGDMLEMEAEETDEFRGGGRGNTILEMDFEGDDDDDDVSDQ